MADDKLKHIFLDRSGAASPFTSPSMGGGTDDIRRRNIKSHSDRLYARLAAAWQAAEQQKQAVAVTTKHGHYLEFTGFRGQPLATKSLEDMRAGVRLLSVRTVGKGESEINHATVYIPEGKEGHFLKKIEQYVEKETPAGNPRNQKLVDSINDIRLAMVESFWQDDPSLIPDDRTPKWCEVWLRVEGTAATHKFSQSFEEIGVDSRPGQLEFPERVVKLVKANKKQLAEIIVHSDSVAEFRLAKETARFFLEQIDSAEQANWAQDLSSRLDVSEAPQVAITILDTGANRGHLLLRQSLASDDCHTYDPDWGTDDDDSHGTLMCGLALYGDLQMALESTAQIPLLHCLESVKILPPPPDKNDPEFYGEITKQGISRAEIVSPEKQRIACMAVSTKDDLDRGRPSSWSSEIDSLASGVDVDGDKKRLFLVAAGNVDPEESKNYPNSNETTSVQDPGQSWNALTVGAFTEKTRITDPTAAGYTPVAQAGGLSPFSPTSLIWNTKKWPAKPDIVLEGGNLAWDNGKTALFDGADFCLLSTGHQPAKPLDWINATSAATAQAAWMAARIQSDYPQAWPETVRALLVHSAQWTDGMKRQFLKKGNKSEYANLLRVCGYGVPDLDRAVSCYENRLTLVAQEEIQPYDKKESRGVSNEMHLHNLPWPTDVLEPLGEMQVTLRITLSYFIEPGPGPGQVGRNNRYLYASHALRFDLNKPEESRKDFEKRINSAARDEDEVLDTKGGSERWKIGARGRNLGSVHSDIWEGTAADLAACNLIGIYPVIGWWRERHQIGKYNRKARYSLIVSLETKETDVDIYTPVYNEVGITVPVEGR